MRMADHVKSMLAVGIICTNAGVGEILEVPVQRGHQESFDHRKFLLRASWLLRPDYYWPRGGTSAVGFQVGAVESIFPWQEGNNIARLGIGQGGNRLCWRSDGDLSASCWRRGSHASEECGLRADPQAGQRRCHRLKW